MSLQLPLASSPSSFAPYRSPLLTGAILHQCLHHFSRTGLEGSLGGGVWEVVGLFEDFGEAVGAIDA